MMNRNSKTITNQVRLQQKEYLEKEKIDEELKEQHTEFKKILTMIKEDK